MARRGPKKPLKRVVLSTSRPGFLKKWGLRAALATGLGALGLAGYLVAKPDGALSTKLQSFLFSEKKEDKDISDFNAHAKRVEEFKQKVEKLSTDKILDYNSEYQDIAKRHADLVARINARLQKARAEGKRPGLTHDDLFASAKGYGLVAKPSVVFKSFKVVSSKFADANVDSSLKQATDNLQSNPSAVQALSRVQEGNEIEGLAYLIRSGKLAFREKKVSEGGTESIVLKPSKEELSAFNQLLKHVIAKVDYHPDVVLIADAHFVLRDALKRYRLPSYEKSNVTAALDNVLGKVKPRFET